MCVNFSGTQASRKGYSEPASRFCCHSPPVNRRQTVERRESMLHMKMKVLVYMERCHTERRTLCVMFWSHMDNDNREWKVQVLFHSSYVQIKTFLNIWTMLLSCLLPLWISQNCRIVCDALNKSIIKNEAQHFLVVQFYPNGMIIYWAVANITL